MHTNIRLSVRNHLRRLMLEDEDFNDIQQSVYASHKYQDGKMYKREIKLYLKALNEKFGIIPKKFLGAGDFGFAFLTQDNKTVKITSDKSEVVEAKKWMDKNPEHLPKIYNLIKIKVGNGQDDAYAIVKEFVLQNKSFITLINNLQQELSTYLNHYHILVPQNVFPHFLEKFFDELSSENISPEDINKFIYFLQKEHVSKYLIWYVQQIYYLYEEMAQLGIDSKDTYGKNMGIKNRKLIYLDPGYGDFDGKGWIEKQPYGAEVAQENIQEDEEVHQSIANSIATPDRKRFSNLDVKKYMAVLKAKFDINVVKFLDSGQNGIALLDSNNRVVKITRDRSEAVEALKYKGKPAVHLPQVYNIIRIKDKDAPSGEMYIIIKDYVLQNTRLTKIIAETILKLEIMYNFHFVKDYIIPNGLRGVEKRFVGFIKDIGNGSQEQFVVDEFVKYVADIKTRDISPRHNRVFNDKKCDWLLKELIELAKELNYFGIGDLDFHEGNFGLKNKKLIYFDVGFGDYYGDTGKGKDEFDAQINELDF